MKSYAAIASIRRTTNRHRAIAPLMFLILASLAMVESRAPAQTTADVHQPMASANFVNIYWDTSWNSDNPGLPTATIDSVTQAFINSSYFNGLSEYGVNSISFGGSLLPDPNCAKVAPSPTVGFYDPNNTAISGFIGCEHDHVAALRQPGTVYNIILPPQSLESDQLIGSTCSGSGSAAAWHYHGLQPFFGGQPIWTIVQTSPQCGGNNAFFHYMFHEMVEALTDPYPFYINISFFPTLNFTVNLSAANEIADLCNGKDVNMFEGAITVGAPTYWSNSKQKCVNFNANVYLLYDHADGVVKTFLSPLPLPSEPKTYVDWSKTWTNLVAGKFGGSGMGDFLFYDRAAGVAEFYSTDETGQSLTPLLRYTNWSPGTTLIIPGNFGGTSATGQTDLLLYNATTGAASFWDVWGTANMNWMKSYSFSPGSTHIIPGNFGGTSATGQSDLLVYNATSGAASFWDVWGTANMNWMKSYSFSPGSTHIIPGNFGGTSATGQSDLLVYNATTGAASFWDVWGTANMNWMKSYSFSPGSSHIVPGNFGGTSATGQTDLLVYNATTGGASFWDVWGWANMNSEPGYSQFANASLYDRWSLIGSGYKTTP